MALFEEAHAIYQATVAPDHPDALATVEYLTGARTVLAAVLAGGAAPVLAGAAPVARKGGKVAEARAKSTPVVNSLSQSEREELERELVQGEEGKQKGKAKKKK